MKGRSKTFFVGFMMIMIYVASDESSAQTITRIKSRLFRDIKNPLRSTSAMSFLQKNIDAALKIPVGKNEKKKDIMEEPFFYSDSVTKR